MKQKEEKAIRNTKIAIVFLVFLTFIVGISLILKAIMLIRASQFDGSRRFTLTITNGKNMEVMSLSPSSKEVTIFKLNDNIATAQAGRLLEIPIDGFIMSNSLDLNQKVNLLFTNAVLKYNSFKTNLTIIDFLRMAMFTRSVSENSVKVKIVKDASGLDIDKVVGHLVSDNFIEKDNQTIQIINATAVSGLGNRLARFVTNMGGDVIMVATSESLEKKSVILYMGKKTYTVERLRKVLGYKAVRESDKAISDITIVIGEDKVNTSPF